jgi:hypothetical protein
MRRNLGAWSEIWSEILRSMAVIEASLGVLRLQQAACR